MLEALRHVLHPGAALLLLPAVLASATGAVSEMSAAEGTRLALLLGVGALSFALAVRWGVGVERHVRRWATARHDALLLHRAEDLTDLYQRLSRDFATTSDSVAAYVHDGVWVSALFAISGTSAVVLFGAPGAAMFALFVALCAAVWRGVGPSVVRTRLQAVPGFNALVSGFLNAVACAGLEGLEEGQQRRSRFCREAMDAYYRSYVESFATKLFFSTCTTFLSGALLVGVAALAPAFGAAPGALALLLTALLQVDRSVASFFGSLSGFESQRVSVHRLAVPATASSLVPPKLAKEGTEWVAAPFEHRGLARTELRFSPGTCLSLVGPSGVGKSQYLRALAGFVDVTPGRPAEPGTAAPVYLDVEGLAALDQAQGTPERPERLEVEAFVEGQLARGQTAFLLDEALSRMPLGQARATAAAIQRRVQAAGGLLLLVDHRFSLERTLTVPGAPAPVPGAA